MRWMQSQSIRGLLQMCTESVRQILRILSVLLNQGLLGEFPDIHSAMCIFLFPRMNALYYVQPLSILNLETFLPFDLDATFSSSIAVLMAATIEPSLLPDYAAWLNRAYSVLEAMSTRGNAIADMHCKELRQLECLLSRLSSRDSQASTAVPFDVQGMAAGAMCQDLEGNVLAFTSLAGGGDGWMGDFGHDFELGAEQLLDLANSLDFSSLT